MHPLIPCPVQTACTAHPWYPTAAQQLVWSVVFILATLVREFWYLTVVQISLFLMADELEFFGCSCIFFCEILVRIFCLLLIGWFVFLLCHKSSLYILDVSPWLGTCVANIFAQHVWLLKLSFLYHLAHPDPAGLDGYQISASTKYISILLNQAVHQVHFSCKDKSSPMLLTEEGALLCSFLCVSCCYRYWQCPFTDPALIRKLCLLASALLGILATIPSSPPCPLPPECLRWAFPVSCSWKSHPHPPPHVMTRPCAGLSLPEHSLLVSCLHSSHPIHAWCLPVCIFTPMHETQNLLGLYWNNHTPFPKEPSGARQSLPKEWGCEEAQL